MVRTVARFRARPVPAERIVIDHLVEPGNIRDVCYALLLAGALVALTWALRGCAWALLIQTECNTNKS